MTWTDIVALVGAAAWVPQIVTWIYRFFTRPYVTLILDRRFEIGFTGNGPILNLRLAIAVDRRDAILDGLYVDLIHESGAKHRLIWHGTVETFSQVVGPAGIRQTIERESPPIALRLSTMVLQEKFVRFQDPAFHDGKKNLEKALLKRIAELGLEGRVTKERVFACSEMKELIGFYRQSFWWKAGGYRVVFGVTSPGRVVLKKCESAFSLSQFDVDNLNSNNSVMERGVAELAGVGTFDGSLMPVAWNWHVAEGQLESKRVRGA